MTTAVSGSLTAFFLYDVAEAIDLAKVQTLVGRAEHARLAPKVTTPSHIQYQQPPIVIDGQHLGLNDLEGFRTRYKAFDYGVLSVALTRPLPPTWGELLSEALRWQDEPGLSAAAEQCCRTVLARLAPALAGARSDLLVEDYFVIAIIHSDGGMAADALLETHGAEIAQLLRGERELLSSQERDNVLQHRISYLANDLVVPTWSSAFVYDTEVGAQGALELLEFANSQLLEFRYYDRLLDGELGRIYAQLQQAGWGRTWLGRRYTRAAHHVHSLFIDVNELTDKAENALKFAGDVYAARVFGLAAARLGLDQWKANVREKLKTLDDIYRFAVERTAMARGEFLELMIVLILVFELVLFFAGLMD